MELKVRYLKNKIILDSDIENKIKEYLELKNELKKTLKNEITPQILNIMEKTGNNIMETKNGIIFKYKNGYVKSAIDTNKLKTDDFELYTKYLTTSDVSATINMEVK
jgi:predicted phage-related endonuclease